MQKADFSCTVCSHAMQAYIPKKKSPNERNIREQDEGEPVKSRTSKVKSVDCQGSLRWLHGLERQAKSTILKSW